MLTHMNGPKSSLECVLFHWEGQQQQQSFYRPLSGTTRVNHYQKKTLPTHYPDHHPIFISFFHLLQSIASSLFKLHAWQSFCTTSLHEKKIAKHRNFNREDAMDLSRWTTTTDLRPFFRDHPGEPEPEENFCTSWCKGRFSRWKKLIKIDDD